MRINKKVKFSITTLWIIFSRSYDAYCTNQFTPDLSKEANPLVSVFGMTWAPLLLVLGLLSIYVIYCYYISVFKPKDLLPKEKGYSFSNISAYLYLGRKDNWYAVLYKLPKTIDRFNHYMGHVFTQALVFAGIVSTAMWLLINHSEFYRSVHSAALIYLILIVGSMVISYFWNRKKYEEYLAVFIAAK